MKRRLVPLALASSALLALTLSSLAPASARPVRIGQYTEIPYGIDPAHPFPTAGGGPRRDGRLRGVAPSNEPAMVWEHPLDERRPRGPTIAADGSLYLGTMSGLSALDPDGTERWSVALGPVHEAPSLAPGGDVVTVTRAGVVAVVSREGVVRRRVDLGAPARGSPLVLDDGSMLVGTIDRRLHRLDANLRSIFATTLEDGTGAPASLGPRNVVAIPSGEALALLDASGRIQHQVGLGARATSSAAVADDGTMWVPTRAGMLFAIDPSGRVRSRTELGSRHYDGASPALGHDGAVRVPTLSEGLVCIGPGGTERWRLTNGAGYNAPATIDEEDTTLVLDRGGRLLAVDANGALRWQVAIGTFSFQPPVLAADGTIYVTTERGAIQAWR